MTVFPARFVLCVALLLAASGCASGGGDASFAALPRFPACDNEIKAFVALTRLAKQLGTDWRIYEPALQAMQDQILDCIDDSYPNPVGI